MSGAGVGYAIGLSCLRATLVPSANELRPYLEEAMAASPSNLELADADRPVERAGESLELVPPRDVRRRKVPKRLPDFQRAEEVRRVLAAAYPGHRALFAPAVYTGMRRKGELAGLRKTDIDFTTGLINVCRSYDQDTTKGGRAAAIPSRPSSARTSKRRWPPPIESSSIPD